MADIINELPYDYYTEEDKAEFVSLIKNDGIAVFLYSRNVYDKNGISTYDTEDKSIRAVAKSGVTFVPGCFFGKYLGFELCPCGFAITKDGVRLEVKDNEKEYTLDGKSASFTLAPFRRGKYVYYPLIEALALFGIKARSYNENKLTLIGDTQLFEAVKKNPRLQYAGGYVVLGSYDSSRFTSEDLRIVKRRWRDRIVGNERINDLSDPDVMKKISAVNASCKKNRAIMHKEPDAIILFGDKPPKDSVDLLTQYSALNSLAVAWGTYGSEFYRNEELKADILYGLEWMFLHMYGDAEIEERGWRSAHAYDWWHWYVGGVEPLLSVLMIMEEFLTLDDMEKYLKCFRWVVTFMRTGFFSHVAMSRIRVWTLAALLLEDRGWLQSESADYDLLLEVKEQGEGPHRDYVQWTHGIPYNMMYGLNNLGRVLNIGALLSGTPIEYTSPRQYSQFNVVKYMFEAAMYKGRGFVMFNGRGNAGTEFNSGVSIINGVLPMIGMFGEDEDAYIKRMIKRNLRDPEFCAMVKARASLYYLSLINEILNDPEIPDDEPFELTHAWYTADRVAQHRRDYCFALCMQSSRHPNYESIDCANKTGWYTGDGALYLYTDTDTKAFDGANFITNNNVAYRVPGTTVDSQKRVVRSLSPGWKCSRDFVGCMQIDERYALAAMDYESYHFEGEDSRPDDSAYGGGFPPHKNDLVAKKSWFMFDDECVCLGAGINSTMDSEVRTIVEHRRLVKDDGTTFGLEDARLNGELLPKDEFVTVNDDAKWLSLEGFAGFVFPNGGKLTVSKYYNNDYREPDMYFVPDPEACKYPLGKPFFEARLEHGENPKGAGYSYVILPYATEDMLKAYYECPDINILSNTDRLQAVYEKNTKVLGVVFWSEGECRGITAHTPCLVTCRDMGDSFSIAVCEPTHKIDTITVTLDGKYEPKDVDDRTEVSYDGNRTVLTLNFSHAYGESARAVFKR